MTILNGHFHHFHSDGIVTEEPDNSRIPFRHRDSVPSWASFLCRSPLNG